MRSSSYLLVRNRLVQRLFVNVFLVGLTIGALRFLFPFQILNLGGDEALASLGATCSAAGQVLGLIVMSRAIRSRRVTLLVVGLLCEAFVVATAFVQDASLLAASRIVEGAAWGLLVILIVRVSCEFESCRGEAVGTLLSALFMGSAIGQGMAGLFVEQISTLYAMQQTYVIQILAMLLSVAPLVGLTLTAPRPQAAETVLHSETSHGHFHFATFVRLMSSKRVVLLAVVYFLYDFSHGFYTPILSLSINDNGVPMDQIGLGYLTGDIIWGIVQLYSGRLVDRMGHVLPLVVSLAVKGLVVFGYAAVSSIYTLVPLLAVAGTAEGFLEPARNDAAMEHSPKEEFTHHHPHYYFFHSSGAAPSIARHEHGHAHLTGSDEVVSLLQTIGIIGFALGSTGGAWLLLSGGLFSTLLLVGGTILVLAGLLSLGLFRRGLRRSAHAEVNKS